MCGWRGIGGKGAVQHGADWRAVSVREPDCMRVPRQGRMEGEQCVATPATTL